MGWFNIRPTRDRRKSDLEDWYDSLPYVTFHGSTAGCLSLWEGSALLYTPNSTPWGYSVPACETWRRGEGARTYPAFKYTLTQPFVYDGSSTGYAGGFKDFHPLKAQPESLAHDAGWVFKPCGFDHNNMIFAAIFKTHRERGFAFHAPDGPARIEALDIRIATISTYYQAVSMSVMRSKWDREESRNKAKELLRE